MSVPLPRLLNSSLQFERTIRPISMSMTLSISPLSYASMELPTDETLPARAYVELYSSMGFAGIFRVRSPQDAYGDDVTTAELEHAIVDVGDYLVLAEYNEMMAASTAMSTVFSHYRGSHWQLGDTSALGSGNVALKADHDRVLDAMNAIMDQRPDCMMAFDFSTTPWTVSIVPRGTVVAAEGRLSRNVNSAKIIYDDTELCTRCYYEREANEDAKTDNFPAFDVQKNFDKGETVTYSGKLYRLTNGHVKGTTWANTTKTLVDSSPSSVWEYVDADTMSTYGLVERTISTGNDYTAAEALNAANVYLAKHKEPSVSVTISAEELSAVTGEPFDTFEIGKLCRLALVDYGVTVERVITGLSWNDVLDRPQDITVTLQDDEDTAVTYIHDIDTKGGSGGGGGRKKQDDVWKEYRTEIKQTDFYLDLYAQRLNRANEVLQQAGLYIDANGVLVYAQDNENNLGSKIQAEADRISLVVEGTGTNAHINPASIILAINGEGGSSVTISADRLDMNGIETYISGFLQANNVDIGWLEVVNSLSVNGHTELSTCDCGSLSADGNVDAGGYVIAGDGIKVGGSSDVATWQSTTVVTGVSRTKTSAQRWGYWNGSAIAYTSALQLVAEVSSTTTTIHYLGKAPTNE